MAFLGIFKSDNERHIAKLEKIASKIEALADKYAALSDDELKDTTRVLKERLAKGETLNDILPDAYAAVRETSTRVMGKRHFHVQLLGGIALFQGRIAEMKTGEGKTLTETLPAYLIALEGKGVHIVTVNEYLSGRDADWMGKIFKFLGLTVGVSKHDMSPDEKRKAYNCDILYSTNNELGFDYLRDNMVVRKEDRVGRGYHYAIIDEVDSILIDEARTPLIISGRGMKSSETYKNAARFAKGLKRDQDYVIDEKEKAIRLTEDGIARAERYFKVANLSDIENIELNHHINNALKAQFIMKLDENYIVRDGEVLIVDEFTGRIMEGRKYSNGLHQAIEAKEGLEIRDENKTLATVTFQNFFRLYDKISGMTGTAKTEETEFNKIYNLDVVTIPTNLPIRRVDSPDIIYMHEKAKFEAVVEEVKKIHATGRPILVGTVTIDKSEKLSEMLRRAKIRHNVLNAKNHAQESEIIAQAGRLNAVTIATNMAGRGTDILLGGNPEFLAKHQMKELGATDEQIEFCTSFVTTDNEELNKLRDQYNKYYERFKVDTDAEKEKVVELGGLHIIGTERHESRRIDNQLRGRSGRQGDPGSSVFFVAMDDELIRRFGGEKMQGIMRFFHLDENTPFQIGLLSKQIENAQRRIEGFNFGARHNVLKFDNINNSQREIIYGERNRVLDGANVHNEIVDMINELAKNAVYENIDQEVMFDEWDLDALNTGLAHKIVGDNEHFVTEDMVDGLTAEELADLVAQEAIRVYEEKCKSVAQMGIDYTRIERDILLRVVDTLWMDHIDFLEMLRSEIGLRAYGNQDPIIAYKQEAFDAFENMTQRIRKETATFMMTYKINIEHRPNSSEQKPAEPKEVSKAPRPQDMITNEKSTEQAKTKGKLVGRNDPCPCGSGKKYKNCCGKN
ncbi:MAG: preprotein translocase subunit SecA [Clostridia bacterium]|nr:preprotein translocase subunit SecA [Clostridia bacterium]